MRESKFGKTPAYTGKNAIVIDGSSRKNSNSKRYDYPGTSSKETFSTKSRHAPNNNQNTVRYQPSAASPAPAPATSPTPPPAISPEQQISLNRDSITAFFVLYDQDAKLCGNQFTLLNAIQDGRVTLDPTPAKSVKINGVYSQQFNAHTDINGRNFAIIITLGVYHPPVSFKCGQIQVIDHEHGNKLVLSDWSLEHKLELHAKYHLHPKLYLSNFINFLKTEPTFEQVLSHINKLPPPPEPVYTTPELKNWSEIVRPNGNVVPPGTGRN